MFGSEKGGGGGGVGGGGGGQPPPLSANLPLMTLFSSLLPPKAISCGFSILCVGEEAFTHLLVLQRRLFFALLCFHAFFTPQRIRLAFAFLSVDEDVSFMSMYLFAFNPLKRFRLAFSFLCVGEDVFIHFFTA